LAVNEAIVSNPSESSEVEMMYLESVSAVSKLISLHDHKVRSFEGGRMLPAKWRLTAK
jgi:hypothetical protein